MTGWKNEINYRKLNQDGKIKPKRISRFLNELYTYKVKIYILKEMRKMITDINSENKTKISIFIKKVSRHHNKCFEF